MQDLERCSLLERPGALQLCVLAGYESQRFTVKGTKRSIIVGTKRTIIGYSSYRYPNKKPFWEKDILEEDFNRRTFTEEMSVVFCCEVMDSWGGCGVLVIRAEAARAPAKGAGGSTGSSPWPHDGGRKKTKS